MLGFLKPILITYKSFPLTFKKKWGKKGKKNPYSNKGELTYVNV